MSWQCFRFDDDWFRTREMLGICERSSSNLKQGSVFGHFSSYLADDHFSEMLYSPGSGLSSSYSCLQNYCPPDTSEVEMSLLLRSVAAGETRTINLLELRDQQVKDVQGRTLPKDLRQGQFFWQPHQGEALIGRVVMLDQQSGTASNFSCPDCCYWLPYRLEGTPHLVSGPPGGFQQMTVNEWDNVCGTLMGPYNVTSSATYSSNNSSVATVSSSGMVSCMAVGSTSINMFVDYPGGYDECGGSGTLGDSCPVAVRPLITIGLTIFNPASVSIGGSASSTGSVSISASPACDTDPNCLHQGDYAMVEIIKNFSGQFFTIIPASQVQNVNLVLGGSAMASFQVAALAGTTPATYQFLIRVSDIRRPDGTGGSTSILQNVVLNPTSGGTQGPLMVSP